MSSATAETWPESQAGIVSRVWRGFRRWRRTRPFWGGLLAMIAGVPILYFPYAKLSIGGLTMTMATTAGAGSLIIGLLLIALGLTAWFQPVVRVFCGVATTILALISIPVSNLGGFGMGALPGLIAGGLLASWAPLPARPAPAADGPAGAPADGPAERTADAPAEAPTAHLPAQAAAEPGAAPQTPAEEDQR
ncbi:MULTISPECIES: DUF6114 domain-containing protein [Kitasatospora]|uniref:Integral membrane protein n=1 Tax=Kitasatospora setae (strain ATCC 33774 / DSM 43861 / JCM 3304 / KCC A-0304 / NBRC 14216 / KM-6054) TaxID=452652 RepID=E4NH58_KITSK|nr:MULTISPECIES: DUF6114 domain-containing protein [Kitasatospora]BAJ30838.1 hypothetical protein KSE_50600 [Kitasatospora setae KM-6054]